MSFFSISDTGAPCGPPSFRASCRSDFTKTSVLSYLELFGSSSLIAMPFSNGAAVTPPAELLPILAVTVQDAFQSHLYGLTTNRMSRPQTPPAPDRGAKARRSRSRRVHQWRS